MNRSPYMAWMLIGCVIVILALTVSGCSTPPIVVTKTVTQTVDVPGPVQQIPAALSIDCPPDPLTGSTIGAVLARLASTETALARCRIQLDQIRALH